MKQLTSVQNHSAHRAVSRITETLNLVKT
ncbi:hypothetical protein CCACVL1_27232 [Corchorus capsularis]|uniref:Uncharacterized protein n=1 Tax=Corchorus capsularis TaxID=210143 RepID=A0A1R3GBL7_COCAP|nr:hypothetical protein CCACVL1_27232 [Corchorus capsularis]